MDGKALKNKYGIPKKISSNIQVQRICQHCGDEFTARTTVTHYCGDTCSKRAYKARVRIGKVEVSIKETRRIKTQPIEVLKKKEYLTVTQVSKLIGCLDLAFLKSNLTI